MVKIRVQRNKKRREGAGMFLPTLLFFIMFPYIIGGFSNVEKEVFSREEIPGQIWVLEKKLWGMQKIPLEEYLIGMLAATIPAEYEPETLKAQAIILRSFCMNQLEKENGRKVIYDDRLKEYYLQPSGYQGMREEDNGLSLEKIRTSIEETKGIIMVCNGDIVEAPFCRMSNGTTRDIMEYVIHKEDYSHMKTVLCEADKMAKDCIQYKEISRKEFEDKLRKMLEGENIKLQKMILYRDANDYVKEIHVGEAIIDGEIFKNELGLASSDYSLEKVNDVIEIKTKGMGHGFGFSQYEANQLALKGNDYVYLLNYFFSNVELEKI